MSDFFKCECWYCGQPIKYPSEGTGIEVRCPTCRKPVTLAPEGSTVNFGSIVVTPVPASNPYATPENTWIDSDTMADPFPKIKTETITLKIKAEDIFFHKTGKREQSQLARVRSEPATEKQKEKLRWFGCTFDESVTKGQASDALDICVRNFPRRERAYYSRPATEEQLAKLHEINKHPDCGPDEPFYDFENEGPLTYGEAKDLIQEWALLRRQKEREYENSQEWHIAEMTDLLNGCGVSPRKITRAEVSKAWNLVVSRSADKSYMPGDYKIVEALAELFSDLRSLCERY